MTLTVGTDSFVSLVDARAIAASYGLTLPADDIQCEIMLRKGTQYVQLFELQFSGHRTDSAQELAWPRADSYTVYGQLVDSAIIPNGVKKATVYAAQAYSSGVSVRGNDNGQFVTHEEVVGAVVVEYSETAGSNGATIQITEADDQLAPYLVSSVGGFNVNRG